MGLIRGVARTAAIAGTATAVSNRVSRRQAGRWAQLEQMAQTAAAPPMAHPVTQPIAAAASVDDKLAQLKELGELKNNGILSEAEFEDQKRKILAT
jgi:HAMP domain-containing protein